MRQTPKFSLPFYRDLLLNLGSSLPYAIEKYRSTAMRDQIRRELQDKHDVVVCDFLAPSINLPDNVGPASILFQHNVESMIWERHYETQSGLHRAYFYGQWRKMLDYERKACSRFDAVVAVSKADRDFFLNQFGIDNVYDVPTGVDIDYFHPFKVPSRPFELVFTGSMDWLPNVDGIRYFVLEILPLIAAEIPDVSLNVVGRNPSASVRSLAENNRRVCVTGGVPDVRPYLASGAVYVVPLRVGGGTRLKIFEAMAMGKPVVSTSIGAEGLPLRPDQEIFLADQPEEFARAVVRLLRNRRLAEQIGLQSRRLMEERFGWDNAADSFAMICEEVVANAIRTRAA